jgi:demethylmenaquinone methyltransferase/2-methoxy-6-polyprenyl-1,4-benzoquinol methylase
MSRWYDLFAGSSEQKFMNKGIEILKPQPGEKILEIGCGTGHGLISLAPMVSPSGRIFGLDISDGMLSRSKALIRKSYYQESIQLQLGDGCHLPYAPNSFSAAFLSFTLELFDTPDISLVLGECRRVLNQNGRIVIVSLDKQESFPVNIYEWFHKYMPSFVDCRPINVQTYLLQASFQITHSSTKKMWGLPVEIVSAENKNIYG